MRLSDIPIPTSYVRFTVSLLLSLTLADIGRLQFNHSGTLRGIVGSFFVVTSIQILLWTFGIRTELFGSAPDPVSAEEMDYSMSESMSKRLSEAIEQYEHHMTDQQREIIELRSKLTDAETMLRAREKSK